MTWSLTKYNPEYTGSLANTHNSSFYPTGWSHSAQWCESRHLCTPVVKFICKDVLFLIIASVFMPTAYVQDKINVANQ